MNPQTHKKPAMSWLWPASMLLMCCTTLVLFWVMAMQHERHLRLSYQTHFEKEMASWDAHKAEILAMMHEMPLAKERHALMEEALGPDHMSSWVSWEVLLHLAQQFDALVVTGSQRAGTTFAAQQLAEVLGYTHIDEHDFGVHDVVQFEQLLQQHPKVVVQAPALLHEMKAFEDRVLLVVMERNPNDIVRSMYRFGWYAREGKAEMSKFRTTDPESPYDLVHTKQAFGYGLKALHLPYDELKKAPGYVVERGDWHIKQVAAISAP